MSINSPFESSSHPPRPRFLHGMSGKEAGKASRRAIIKKNQHPARLYS
jgi:hypothetical protein